ncbi:MAG: hypothetical protein KGL35_31710, partial [Bradyrhizobium sp.]|nr:hypothetical protein [Bradyrhizobium sp.]
MLALLPVAAVVGALGRRLSGGLVGQWFPVPVGTQGGRAIWGASAGLTAWAAGAVWWQALGVAVCIATGGMLAGFWGSMAMGRVPGLRGYVWAGWPRYWRDFAFMSLHGMGGVAAMATGAAIIGHPWGWAVAAGALCAPCYALAWLWPLQAPWL